nr:transforming growth factor beta [Hymenolepis microstoma]
MNQHLQVYRVIKTRMDLVNTIKLSSIAFDVFCVDNFAVIASNKNYIGIDLKTKTSQEIVARAGSLARPLIDFFSEDEFLLSGPGSLGIFVNTVGQSNRPPLTLSNNLLALFSNKQLVFAVDDEFLTIHNVSLGKQVQTLVVQNACAACMSLDKNIIFIATHNPTTNVSQIHVVQPETWDLVAKRLISAGCLSEATNLLNNEFTKLVNLCNERPATSGYAKRIFNTRSKRVYTLMGLYLFENGQLAQSREFFEKSSLDIRELLSRYVDLLPREYEFTADPTLHITASSKVIPENIHSMTEGQPPPCNIYNLVETTGVSVTEFRKFLLNFLLENRRGKIFAQHSQNCTGGPDLFKV